MLYDLLFLWVFWALGFYVDFCSFVSCSVLYAQFIPSQHMLSRKLKQLKVMSLVYAASFCLLTGSRVLCGLLYFCALLCFVCSIHPLLTYSVLSSKTLSELKQLKVMSLVYVASFCLLTLTQHLHKNKRVEDR